MWCGECGAAGTGNAGVMKHTLHPPLVPVLAADACLDSFDRLAGWLGPCLLEGWPAALIQIQFNSTTCLRTLFPGCRCIGQHSTAAQVAAAEHETLRILEAGSGIEWRDLDGAIQRRNPSCRWDCGWLGAGGHVALHVWRQEQPEGTSGQRQLCCPACVCLGLDLLLLLLSDADTCTECAC